MQRVFLAKDRARKYFQDVRLASGLSTITLANKLEISGRTLRDWISGKYSFSLVVAKQMEETYGVALPRGSVIKDESLVKSDSGRLGGVVSYAKHGNPGTSEGRSKGGINSLVTHKRLHTGFKLLKEFPWPKESRKLAEFLGIMLGDGGMTENQIRITLSSRDDVEYSNYVRNLMRGLFGEYPAMTSGRPSTLDIYLSGRSLVKMLKGRGLVVGNKIRQGIEIPDWIWKKKAWIGVALRGLFDTDGSVYLDRHGKYRSICIAYTSYSPSLLRDIQRGLRDWGFLGITVSGNNVMLRRRQEVVEFFSSVNPANPKHRQRFRRFLEECAEW